LLVNLFVLINYLRFLANMEWVDLILMDKNEQLDIEFIKKVHLYLILK